MEKNKKSLFKLSLPLQFLIYYAGSFMLFFFGFLIMGIKVIDVPHLALACLCIALFTAGMMTAMIWQSNEADKWYKTLELIEKSANEAKTVRELIMARDELGVVRQMTPNGGAMISECKRIKTLIDTRLKYEFKV